MTALAVGGLGVVAVLLLKKKAPETAPEELEPSDGEVDEEQGVIRLPEAPVRIPPITVQPPIAAPPVVLPPVEDVEDVDEVEDVEVEEPEELEPIAPPFVPPPVFIPAPPPTSSRPIPAPPPPVSLPPLAPPGIEPGIPDLVQLPPQRPAPVPVINPVPPPVVRLPLPAPEEPAQPDVPDDTALLVSTMLEKEGGRWKTEEPELADWLQARGEPRSTKFGPGSAKLMAEEIGTLPIIRFWPTATGANPQRAIDEYRAALATIARSKPEPHRSQLLASAQRERGQSFGPPVGDGGATPIRDRVTIDLIGEDA